MSIAKGLVIGVLGVVLITSTAISQTYEAGQDPRKALFRCSTDDVQFPTNEELNEAIKETNGEYDYQIRQISEGPFSDIDVQRGRDGEFEVRVFTKGTNDEVFRGRGLGFRKGIFVRLSVSDSDATVFFEITQHPDGKSIVRGTIEFSGKSKLQASCDDIVYFD